MNVKVIKVMHDHTQDLKKIMAEIFRVPEDQIAATASMKDVKNWDSLQHLNLILAVEENFDIRFETDEIPRLTSFSILIDNLNAALRKTKAKTEDDDDSAHS